MTAPKGDAELREFARDHLAYEAKMLGYATGRLAELAEGASGPDASELVSAMVESFAVHVRCLNDFLWNDDSGWRSDAFAWHYCLEGVWQQRRSEVQRPHLESIIKRRRLAMEVVHLSYERLGVTGTKKLWKPLAILREIEAGLRLLTVLALSERMDAQTREAIVDLAPALDRQPVAGATGISVPTWMS